jgi:hypothetical protein
MDADFGRTPNSSGTVVRCIRCYPFTEIYVDAGRSLAHFMRETSSATDVCLTEAHKVSCVYANVIVPLYVPVSGYVHV